MKTYVSLRFRTDDIPGGAAAILGPTECKKDVARIIGGDYVVLELEEHDERLAKVLALLEQAGENPLVMSFERYTEEEYQAAPLLRVWLGWTDARTGTGPLFGVTYNVSEACLVCLTGVRQTSPLVVNGSQMLTVNKHRVASTTDDNLLVRDTDVENLIAATVTGVNFWPVTAKYKSGAIGETRWQQAVIENVLPPMAPSTGLDDGAKCATCGRGRSRDVDGNHNPHITYRREDLSNIRDFNLSWEWFGPFGKYDPDAPDKGASSFRPLPWIFVTPKVMNLIRGKTKKEENYQGCGFTPIWIDDGDGVPKLAT